MKKQLLFLIAACFCFLLLSFAFKAKENDIPVITLTNLKQTYVAGEPITLSFKSNIETNAFLVLKSSYGSIVVNSAIKSKKLDFRVPDFFARKTAHVSWQLVQDTVSTAEGSYDVIANKQVVLENYLGPRSMLVGNRHYTMMVAVPTDNFDNPKPDGTPTTINAQFLSSISHQNIPVKDLISWQRLYAPEKSGKLLTSVSCFGIETKETETDVYPSLPTDFSIHYSRNHDYADGNQETILTTSIIKDEFDNTVADGTMVEYCIVKNKDVHLKTYGATINGIAQGKILAPEQADNYIVKAYINGMAESNALVINYLPLQSNIGYTLSKDKRTITTRPIKSFMNQLAPDGTTVTLRIYNKGKQVAQQIQYSNKGVAVFTLSAEKYKEKEYTFTITAFNSKSAPATLKYDQDK